MENQKKNVVIWKFILAILLCESVGIISGLIANANNNQWLETLNKPSWNPPAYLFGPVWTTLYVMLGIALFLVWKSNSDKSVKQQAIRWWAIQMVFNFLWSFIFFNQHQIGLAFLDIFVMWIIITVTIFAFAKINKLAAWLLVPYIAWVTFAGILNFAIWRMN